MIIAFYHAWRGGKYMFAPPALCRPSPAWVVIDRGPAAEQGSGRQPSTSGEAEHDDRSPMEGVDNRSRLLPRCHASLGCLHEG
jgi:hypothetical protein